MDTSAVILSVAMFYHCEVETRRASACARISRRYEIYILTLVQFEQFFLKFICIFHFTI